MSELTPHAKSFLEETVKTYMRQAGMFTSLDITNQAKDAGYQVRNYQVADWLRRNAIAIAVESSYMYNQSLITVDSHSAGMTKAYLYHHYMDDTDDYMDRDQNPKSFKTTLSPFLASPPVFDPHAKPSVPHLAQALHNQPGIHLPKVYFRNRELARDFARDHNEYKFLDCGVYAGTGYRWSCVER